MKFDKIIMNPPYDGNLHLKILNKVLRENPDAIVVNLSPSRWLEDPLRNVKKTGDFKRFKDITDKISDVEIISIEVGDEVSKSFNAELWSNLGILTLQKGGSYDFNRLIDDHKGLIEKIILPYLSKEGLGRNTHFDREIKKPYFIRVSRLHGHVGKPDWSEWVSPIKKFALEREIKGSHFIFNFDTQEEADNFFDYLNLKAVKFVNVVSKQTVDVPWGCFPWTDDYKTPWSNKRFCEYFHISGYISDTEAVPDSEWEDILKTMKNFE